MGIISFSGAFLGISRVERRGERQVGLPLASLANFSITRHSFLIRISFECPWKGKLTKAGAGH